MVTAAPETVEVKVEHTQVALVRADITGLEVDAFVYYARPDLVLGSGFGTAIAARGGPTIQKELEGQGPIATGEAVVSGAGKLKAQYIVHAVGPRFNEEDTEGKLRRTVQSALRAAEQTGCQRIALPPMGAGFYMVPLDLCARVMTEEIRNCVEQGTSLAEIVICVADRREYEAFEPLVARLGD